MVSIKPVVKLFTQQRVAVTRNFVQKPQNVLSAESLRGLRIATDELCLSNKKQFISLDEVKALFPTGKLEENYIIRDIKDLLSRIKTERKLIDLTPDLSEKDYGIIQSFMNRDNGRFIQQ